MSAICLLLAKPRLQVWHRALVEGLRRDGHAVSVNLSGSAPPEPPALMLVEQLERLLFQRGRPSPCDRVQAGEWTTGHAARPDIVLDLTGARESAPGAVAPSYDGVIGDHARDAALLEGRAPSLALAREGIGALAHGLPAIEERPSLLRGRAAVAQRTQTLIRAFVGGAWSAATPLARTSVARVNPASYFVGNLGELARRKLSKLVAFEGHWRIGWRPFNSPSTLDTLNWPEGNPWRWLNDDRRRYFADPFVFSRDGKTYLFCEEYPYATRKGVISVCELNANGAGEPRTVLERPYHLSYPFVFAHAGQIWMMPESSANLTLELYRAVSFPDRWVLDTTLLSGSSIADATAFAHGDGWWLTATTQEPETSSWDCLSLFSASSPIGPWKPSGRHPVLIDASSARPAGHVVAHSGKLWRPAQDCTDGYGSGLALCRIDALREGVLEQTVVARLRSPPGAPAEGVHTLNADAGFEVIDAVGPRLRKAWLGDRSGS